LLQVMAATTSSTEEVYPDEIQELLKDSKYKNACSIAFAALVIGRVKFTVENRLAVEKELSSMETLRSGLVCLRVDSDGELKTLSEIENSSLQQLAMNVPNIQEMPQYSVFTSDQRLTIKSALMRAERHKEIAETADAVKELFSKIEPLELARILKVSLSVAEELKKSSQTTSSDSQEPSQAPKDPEATMGSQKRAQEIEDICGKLQSIPPRIQELRELVYCCLNLVQQLDYYISGLESWLKEAIKKEREEAAKKEREEKIIRQKGNASKNEKEKNIITQKENATNKDIEWESATDNRWSWKY
ncbi:hypothetical protein MKX03_013961, partial [Papaver bracteatum]